MIRAVPGWMCKVDWDWELGEAQGGCKIHASEEDLRSHRRCVDSRSECHTPFQVVVMSKEDFNKLWCDSTNTEELYSSNLGPVFWTKEKGFV